MIIHCYNETHPYLLFLDLEFEKHNLIQFAGLIFKRIDDNGAYQLCRSLNQYRNPDDKVGYPFAEYTGITSNFLKGNGIPIEDLRLLIYEDFLNGIPLGQLEVISHGLRNDRLVLSDNGINLSTYIDKNGKVKPIDGYCTFNNAKRILKRKSNLKEGDIAQESGYYLFNAHNAFNDVWGEVAVFTFLKKIEKQNQVKILN